MAEKKISGLVSFGAETFRAGDEEKLSKTLKTNKVSKEDVQRLTDAGAIEGYGATKKIDVTADPTVLAGQKTPARSAGHEDENIGGEAEEVERVAESVTTLSAAPEDAPSGYGREGGKRGGR